MRPMVTQEVPPNTEKSVLIVDDSEMQLRLFEAYASTLTKASYKPAQALEAAVEQLDDGAPDLILLDNRLHPYDDFRQTVPRIRDAGYSGKIVVMSSEINHPMFLEAAEFDVADVVDKSEFNSRSFAGVIGRYLD